MFTYEVTFNYVGKGKKPMYAHTEYGFGCNPPLIVKAKNMKNVRKNLKLPSTVKIRKIRRI